jgi:hypothetical protein
MAKKELNTVKVILVAKIFKKTELSVSCLSPEIFAEPKQIFFFTKRDILLAPTVFCRGLI